jgi:uncharacterized iron-regulated membrane protein
VPETAGGDFFFELHWNLHAGTIGLYIVGLAGMLMLAAIVSGVITHKRIFQGLLHLPAAPRGGSAHGWTATTSRRSLACRSTS